MKTTLKAIRNHGPCESGWVKLLASLGKTKADDEPISILEILESNGLDDALWCLRAVDGHDKEIRLYAVWCARQVQHLMTDKRSLDALDVAEAFANGKVTKKELAAAGAAWAADGDAAGAAWAAEAAALAAAWSAARDAALAAALAAARDAAWAAAEAAAEAAARAAAEAAAWSATWSAARAAAWSAAGAAAWSAAGAATMAAQEKELIRICKLSEKEKSHV